MINTGGRVLDHVVDGDRVRCCNRAAIRPSRIARSRALVRLARGQTGLQEQLLERDRPVQALVVCLPDHAHRPATDVFVNR